jgi:hypothetical protein
VTLLNFILIFARIARKDFAVFPHPQLLFTAATSPTDNSQWIFFYSLPVVYGPNGECMVCAVLLLADAKRNKNHYIGDL